MKLVERVFIILFLLSANITLISQENEITDIPVISDSLTIIIPEVTVDSTKIDYTQLKKNVNSYIDSLNSVKKRMLLPYMFYWESYHLNPGFLPNLIIKKNNFSVLSDYVTSFYFRNYLPFYEVKNSNYMLEFTSSNYDFPVAISQSNFGIGDHDETHIQVSLKKKEILNIKGLRLNLDFLSYSGLWSGLDEKTRNYKIDLFYDDLPGRIHFSHLAVDQEFATDYAPIEYSSNAKYINFEPQLIPVKISEYSIIYENKFLNLGFRREKREFSGLKDEFFQSMVNKKLQIQDHKLSASFEYLWERLEKESSAICSFDHDSKIAGFNLASSFQYLLRDFSGKDREEYFVSSKLLKKFYTNCNFLIKYLLNQGEDEDTTEEKYGAGLLLSSALLNSEIIFGEKKLHNEKLLFFETENLLDIRIKKMNILLKNWVFFMQEKKAFDYAEFQSKQFLTFVYDMKHNNFLKLGLSHHYSSIEFDGFSADHINNLDLFFAIQITNKFEIKAEAINLTNNDLMFGNDLYGTHFNFSVQWIFIN